MQRKRKKSIIQAVRDLIDAFRQQKVTKHDPLFDVCGIVEDKPDVAENYEDYLYGKKK